jgi:SAM-dependent methyltransferase
MAHPGFKDHFSSASADYRKFRPNYPKELFAWLAGLAPAGCRAWDCATGTGQAARSLSEHFDLVIATDASLNQLREAERRQNLQYLAALAEQPPFLAASIDLITVAAALHWFDPDKFFAVAAGVLKKGGVIAAWSYELVKIDTTVDRIVNRLYYEILAGFWPPERQLVDDGYRSIPFPFREIRPPAFRMTAAWTAVELLGYLSTWSAVGRYESATGKRALESIEAEILAAWGDPERRREMNWSLNVRVGIND